MSPSTLPCPACKKNISDSIDTCPKCGHPITEQDREAAKAKAKKWQMGCGLALLIVVVLAVIGSMGSKDKKSTGQTVEPAAQQSRPEDGAKPTFSCTAEDVVERFNQAARKMAFAHQAKMTKTSSGPEASSVQVEVGKHVAMVVVTPKGARNASGVMFIGVGDGTIKSGAAIIEGMVVLIATLSPELNASGRGDVLRDLGLLGGGKPPKQTNTVRGNVKYSYGYVEGMGTIFGADAI